MENNDLIDIRSGDDKLIQFKPEFADFSTQVKEKKEGEELPVNKDSWVLEIMKQFLEAHDYKRDSMRCEKPFAGKKIEDNLDQKTIDVLQPYAGPEKVDEMKQLVDAAFYLGFEEFKDACLAFIAIEFCAGPTEADLEEFRQKNDLTEDLTQEEEEEINNEYKEVFDALNKQFEDELEQEKEKFMKDDEEEAEQQSEG